MSELQGAHRLHLGKQLNRDLTLINTVTVPFLSDIMQHLQRGKSQRNPGEEQIGGLDEYTNRSYTHMLEE